MIKAFRPNSEFKLDESTIAQLEQRAIEAILQITPKKLKEASAKDLVAIATQIRELIKKDKPEKKSDVDVRDVLSAIRSESRNQRSEPKAKNEQRLDSDGQGSGAGWVNSNPGETQGSGVDRNSG